MYKKYRIFNIKWDTDGDKAALRMLPKEVNWDGYVDEEDLEDEEDGLADILSDYLSDNWGYCHFGFEYEEVK